jgi:hypothetical protein
MSDGVPRWAIAPALVLIFALALGLAIADDHRQGKQDRRDCSVLYSVAHSSADTLRIALAEPRCRALIEPDTAR